MPGICGIVMTGIVVHTRFGVISCVPGCAVVPVAGIPVPPFGPPGRNGPMPGPTCGLTGSVRFVTGANVTPNPLLAVAPAVANGCGVVGVGADAGAATGAASELFTSNTKPIAARLTAETAANATYNPVRLLG